MTKILVTGANGLMGQKLCLLLDADPDISLIATARNKLNFNLSRGKFANLDVTRAEEVEAVIETYVPDVIIHTAAMTQVDQCETQREACWTNNVSAVAYLVAACEKNKVHLVHISTDFIFDGTHGPLDESEKPNPVSYYGESKLAAEVLIQKSKINWTILRTILVYGVTQDMSRSNIVLWVKKSLEEGKTISLVNDQWRTPTLAEDLAMGSVLAAKKRAKGIFNIGGIEMLTPLDIAYRTADFFKLNKALINPTDSSQFKQPARRPPRTGFIIDKAKKELGYRPHSFEEGLAILSSQLKS